MIELAFTFFFEYFCVLSAWFRMFVQDVDVDTESVCPQSKRTLFSMLKSWLQGDAIVHREGATQAPWDCQVDVLFEWHGEYPLDHPLLCKARAHLKVVWRT